LTPTRILLAALPRMLEEIVVHALSSDSGTEIVGTVRDVAALPRKIARLRPDVVVLGRNDVELAVELLQQRPKLAVLAVAEEANVAWLYALSLDRIKLSVLSPTTLVEAIRHATEPEAVGARWSA